MKVCEKDTFNKKGIFGAVLLKSATKWRRSITERTPKRRVVSNTLNLRPKPLVIRKYNVLGSSAQKMKGRLFPFKESDLSQTHSYSDTTPIDFWQSSRCWERNSWKGGSSPLLTYFDSTPIGFKKIPEKNVQSRAECPKVLKNKELVNY